MSIRRICVTAICLGLGAATGLGCSDSGTSEPGAAIAEVGTVGFPLETFGQSGMRYRLHNAVFEIRDKRTARVRAVLNSDDQPFSSLISAELDAGDYEVMLQPGWFIEQLGNDGSFPGASDAALESNAIQDFTIFPNSSSFVFYTFRVGDNVISFEPGSINVIFEVIEDGVVVDPPDPCDDVAGMKRPSVIETSVAAMQFVTLRDVFNAMASNEGFSTDGETIYKQIIDSYASADLAQLPDAVHCGDETTDGVPTLNGYPITCNRQERLQFDNLDRWVPTAFVNRFDLAPENGAHCGQQRMVFASNAIGRMFFIVEAQIPNPQPDLGLDGCAPLVEFWAAQTQIEDPTLRGIRLTNAFLSGDPDLQSRGFGPFVTASNYTVGSGQIRTNNFDDAFWTLREFKLATDSGEVKAIPFPVAEAPHGPLWNDNVSLPNGEFCREAFLTSLQGVLVDEPAAMAFVVPQECRDAESRNTFEQDYLSQMRQGSGALPDSIDALLIDSLLNSRNIAARASFAGSCIGCHNEQVGRDLGWGVTAPFSLDFVHVGEFTEICPDGNACFATSSGLQTTFLPHRIDVLGRLADVAMPPSCGGGTTAVEESFETAEVVADGGVLSVDPVSLPAADTPVEELVKQDEKAREAFGRRTVGGQDARVSH